MCYVSQKRSWLLTTRTCHPSRAHRRVRAPERPSDPLSGLRTTPPLPSAPGWGETCLSTRLHHPGCSFPTAPWRLKGRSCTGLGYAVQTSQSLSHVTSVSRATPETYRGPLPSPPGPTFQVAQSCPLHHAAQVACPSQVCGTQLGMRSQGL